MLLCSRETELDNLGYFQGPSCQVTGLRKKRRWMLHDLFMIYGGWGAEGDTEMGVMGSIYLILGSGNEM